MQSKRTRLSKEERRSQIIAAAQSVFVEQGYNGTTTIEIARVANISEVTLFRYFNSKQELFLSVIEPILVDSFQQTIDEVKGLSITQQLEKILFERLTVISIHADLIRLILREQSLMTELGKGNLIDQFTLLFQSILKQLAVSDEVIEFSIRLMMGSMLSFLYKPEKDHSNIKQYVTRFVTLLNQILEKGVEFYV